MKLLIGTTNPAKRKELERALEFLEEKGIKLVSLADFNIKQKPRETGATFKENSEIKAKFYGEKTEIATIADDGGLAIDILGGKPGVKSRRWPGYEASDEELINYTLEKLKGVPGEKRTAKLVTCVCFYHPQRKSFLCQQVAINGYIAQKPSSKPTNGYPFRSIFIVEEFNKYYDDLTEEEHQKINHRLKAVKKIQEMIARSWI